MCFRVVSLFVIHDTRLLFFSFIFRTVLPAISNSSITPPSVGCWVVRHFPMSIFFYTFPSETTQKHPYFFHPMPPKSPYPPLTSLPTPPVLSPLCRPYLIPGFYVTYICSFAGDVLFPLCHRHVCVLYYGCPLRTDHTSLALLLQWITIMAPWYQRPCELVHQAMSCNTIRRIHGYCSIIQRKGTETKQRLLLAV